MASTVCGQGGPEDAFEERLGLLYRRRNGKWGKLQHWTDQLRNQMTKGRSGIRIIASFFVPRPLICVQSDPSSWGWFVNCLQILKCLYSRTACTSHRPHLVLKGGGDVRARVKKQFSTNAIYSKSFYEVGVDNYGERKKLHTGSSIIIC